MSYFINYGVSDTYSDTDGDTDSVTDSDTDSDTDSVTGSDSDIGSITGGGGRDDFIKCLNYFKNLNKYLINIHNINLKEIKKKTTENNNYLYLDIPHNNTESTEKIRSLIKKELEKPDNTNPTLLLLSNLDSTKTKYRKTNQKGQEKIISELVEVTEKEVELNIKIMKEIKEKLSIIQNYTNIDDLKNKLFEEIIMSLQKILNKS